MHKLPFRQVHLDFHTSPAIEGIGAEFGKQQFQEVLKTGHINSITCFATCHHGWSYYDTKVGKRHPHLSFDLLRAQFDAAKEIGINVPVYLTAGFHNLAVEENPGWCQIGSDGLPIARYTDAFKACFKRPCFNSPYLDHLCEQIEEVVALFPDADGIFLDIIAQGPCYCRYCVESMLEKGMDPEREPDRLVHAKTVLGKYYERATAAVQANNTDMPVFHNSGHIQRGNRDVLKYFSHLELESLPTGGWGYDHFPVSAKYVHNLDLDYLGMTGKFHTTWGEFGGYKHPNALKYECAAMLAFGAKCSIGDQLHPSGRMDPGTYDLIGSAYAEVEAKEPWCANAENIADIGLLSSEAVNGNGSLHKESSADTGAGRMLLEGHLLFEVLDAEMDFSGYRMLILPDDIRVDPELKARLDAYLAGGGKLLLTGTSGLKAEDNGFLFDIGAEDLGSSEFSPDYVLPCTALCPDFIKSPLVMYRPSRRIKVTSGQSLGEVYDPYFNRSYLHFCSHQHTPARPESSGFDCGVLNGNILYLSHPIFSIYRRYGAVAYKEVVLRAIRMLLGKPSVEVDLPSSARVALMDQREKNRYVLHLLYANTMFRGGKMEFSGGTAMGELSGIEVIEDLVPLYDVKVSLSLPKKVESIKCVPDGAELEFQQKDGHVKFILPKLLCHQMIEVKYC